MSTPPEKSKKRINPLLDDEEIKIAAEPVAPRVMPDFVEKHMQAAQQKRVTAADGLPPPPRLAMLSGIFTFPFYLNALGAWMGITFGLMVSGWLLMFWIQYGAVMGASTVYYLGLPAMTASLLTLGYASACCFNVVEQTADGWDSFEVSAVGDWKDWVWDFMHLTALILEAGVLGYAVHLLSSADSYLPMAVVTIAVFPPVFLGALAADGAWAPLGIVSVLRSIVPVWWAWILFYLETGAMIVGWMIVTSAGLNGLSPWLTPLYAAPILATVILIHARLTGRLAGCITKTMSTLLDEGDEDDEE